MDVETGRPRISPPFGFTGCSRPGYPFAWMFRINSWPAFPGTAEAPTIATLFGSKNGVRLPLLLAISSPLGRSRFPDRGVSRVAARARSGHPRRRERRPGGS